MPWDVRVRLAGNVHFVALHAKGVDEVLPESHKLRCYIVFVLGRHISGRETRANWLFDIDNVREVVPAPWVLNGAHGAGRPQERTVLFEQTRQRRAAGLWRVIRKKRTNAFLRPLGGLGGKQEKRKQEKERKRKRAGEREVQERLTPPLSHMRISLGRSGLVVGQNQKKSFPLLSPPTGSCPAYDSPTSTSRSGMPSPFTANAGSETRVRTRLSLGFRRSRECIMLEPSPAYLSCCHC